jgi:hypothetical protein
MSKKLIAAIAAGALAVGLLLGAVGAVVAGDGPFKGVTGSGGDFQCDASHMGSHMTTEQMSQMMGGSFEDMMGSGMGAGMGSGAHSQHHGAQP